VPLLSADSNSEKSHITSAWLCVDTVDQFQAGCNNFSNRLRDFLITVTAVRILILETVLIIEYS